MEKTKISPNQLGDTISSLIKEYADDVVRDLPDTVQEVAKATVKELKNRSAELFDGTKYQKSFKSKKLSDSSNLTSYVIYSDMPHLTSWLEHGHIIKNKTGKVYGTTRAKPHWADAEEKAIEDLEKKLTKDIEGTK